MDHSPRQWGNVRLSRLPLSVPSLGHMEEMDFQKAHEELEKSDVNVRRSRLNDDDAAQEIVILSDNI